MNKKTNTVLFLIGATVFNMVVTVASFIVLIIVYGRLIAPLLPNDAAAWGLPVIFIAAIAIAFVVYRFAVKLLLSKIDAEKVFDPLIKPRRRLPNRRD